MHEQIEIKLSVVSIGLIHKQMGITCKKKSIHYPEHFLEHNIQ
jgi:hypothetical protein